MQLFVSILLPVLFFPLSTILATSSASSSSPLLSGNKKEENSLAIDALTKRASQPTTLSLQADNKDNARPVNTLTKRPNKKNTKKFKKLKNDGRLKSTTSVSPNLCIAFINTKSLTSLQSILTTPIYEQPMAAANLCKPVDGNQLLSQLVMQMHLLADDSFKASFLEKSIEDHKASLKKGTITAPSSGRLICIFVRLFEKVAGRDIVLMMDKGRPDVCKHNPMIIYCMHAKEGDQMEAGQLIADAVTLEEAA